MKHLKLFETKFDQNYLLKFDKEKNELYKLIQDFIQFENIWNFDKTSSIANIYIEHDIDEIGDTALIIIVINANLENEAFYLSGKELEKLYNFLKDPEIYKATKKYNL